jgi:Zn-dependent protease with chaperone function
MKKSAMLTVFLLAAPVLALTVSSLCEQKMNAELRKEIVAQRSDVTEAELRGVTVRRLLADQDPSELGSVRVQIRHFDLMRIGSVALIAVVLLYYAALWAAGRLAVRDRHVLLRVFKPGFFAASALLVVTTIVNAALLMSAIYYGESYIIGAIHVRIIGLIGIGAVVGAFGIIKALVTSRKKATTAVFGKVLPESDHPRIWSEVRSLAEGIGSLPPEHIIMGLDPTFFVTEGEVVCLDGQVNGRTMFISAPLCRLLEASHFRAIVGHELGHFKGEDTVFSQKFYPVYRGLLLSLAGLERSGGTMSLAVVPTKMMLATVLDSFAKAETKLSRERELAADSVAVSVTDSRTFAVALTRIIVSAPYWQHLEEEYVRWSRTDQAIPNVSAFIAERAFEGSGQAMLDELGRGKMSHPTDTHPTLTARLEAVGTNLVDIKDAIFQEAKDSPAIAIVDKADTIEAKLSDSYRESLSRRYDLSHSPED